MSCPETGMPKALPATKEFLDVGKFQLDIGRTPVIALAAAGRAFHLAQPRVHFIAAKTAPRAHRMVAGHCRENMIEPFFERLEDAIVRAKGYGEFANEPRRVAAFQRRGHFMHTATAPGPKGSTTRPNCTRVSCRSTVA
jgi:hypothetical protein